LREASIRFDFADPTTNIKPLKVRNSLIKPFSLAQIKSIIDEVPASFKDYFIIRFFTGLRTGEIHGLRWENVDVDKRQIVVCESLIDGVREITKSASSDRIVHMSDIVQQAFKRLQNDTNQSYVFTRSDEPLTQSYITQSIWYPALDRLNLVRRRPYECRHAAASHWLSAGENYAWVSQQLGHSSSQVLFSVYSNFIKDVTRNDGSAVNEMLNNSPMASIS
jgi:integrase